jgi:hypothetical protein
MNSIEAQILMRGVEDFTKGMNTMATRRDQNRQFDEQLQMKKDEMTEQKTDRNRTYNLAQTRANQSLEHEKRVEGFYKTREAQEAIRQVNEVHKQLSDSVNNGTMTAEQANEATWAFVENMVQGPDMILQKTVLAPLAKNKRMPLFTAPPNKGVMETAPSRNFQRWQEEYKRADELLARARQSLPSEAAALAEQAKKIKADADAFFKPSSSGSRDEDMETVTEETDTETGKIRVSHKRPRGTSPSAGSPAPGKALTYNPKTGKFE